jgi:dolichol-phosphate mannosyltransferase
MEKIVIVMPTYNEAKNISLMIDTLFEKEFPKIKGAEMHLLVVDDNSPDGTGEIVKENGKKYPNLHLLTGEKQGLGWAYVRGMKYAMEKLNADAVLEMDADFQHPPRFIRPMVEAYLNGAEYVIGSRYIKGGSIPKEWAWFRKFLSYFGNLFIRLCLLKPSLHDLTTGFRLSKVKGVLDKIDLENLMELKRFAYKIDLLYQSTKLAKKVVEVPLEFVPRTQEKSKLAPQEILVSFKVAIILGIKDKMRLIKMSVVGGVGFIINFVFLRLFRSMGLPEIIVWLFSTEAAIINNYIFNNIWTFKEKKIAGLKNTLIKFAQFNLTSAGALVIQSIFGPIGVKLIGVKYDFIVLGFVVLLMVLPYNYLMYNLVIWKTWKLPFLSKKSK